MLAVIVSTFFTSDHHFGHRNIITYCNRPFNSIEHMNEVLIQKWNETVSPEDMVFYLGDFSLGKQWVRDIAPKLNGVKHLIAGNHDWCHPVQHKNKKQLQFEAIYRDAGFVSIALEDTMVLADILTPVRMHHMPYTGDHHSSEERYQEYRPINNGDWLLHGHVHTTWKIKDRQINVGVDVWDFKPVGLAEIVKIIGGSTHEKISENTAVCDGHHISKLVV